MALLASLADIESTRRKRIRLLPFRHEGRSGMIALHDFFTDNGSISSTRSRSRPQKRSTPSGHARVVGLRACSNQESHRSIGRRLVRLTVIVISLLEPAGSQVCIGLIQKRLSVTDTPPGSHNVCERLDHDCFDQVEMTAVRCRR